MFGGILVINIKSGIVVSRNLSERTVRVKSPIDDVVSRELQVLRQSNDNWLPKIDEEVVVVYTIDSNGFVIGVVQ